jgi:hypothetical protein
MPVMIKSFLTLMVVETITQVPPKWTQTVQCGKELLFMMAKFMVRNNIKEKLMTSRRMEKNKKLLLTLDFHMHQHLFNLMPQEQFLYLILEFHIYLVLLTIQVHQQWIQTPKFGKELTFIMAKFMDLKKDKMMQMIFKNMEMIKKLLPIQDFHTLPLFSLRVRELDLLNFYSCHKMMTLMKI